MLALPTPPPPPPPLKQQTCHASGSHLLTSSAAAAPARVHAMQTALPASKSQALPLIANPGATRHAGEPKDDLRSSRILTRIT